jgi:5-formyltetrahydrofolate cyclo-ligase
MASEIDPRPLMQALDERGHGLALPVVAGAGQPLVFRAWTPGDPLRPAAFNTREPGPDKAEVTPRVLLVPLLAFDRAGYRLGYGGGFYDRTLAGLRAAGAALAVGLAFAGQEVESVPRDPNDSRLDWIVTEAEAIRIGNTKDR